MYSSTNFLKILALSIFFSSSYAMIKIEKSSGELVKADSMLENLTNSIFQKIKINPNLLFTKPCANKHPLVFNLCTKEHYAPLLENLVSRKALDKDAVFNRNHEKYPLIIFALAHRAKKNITILLAAQPDLNITGTNPNAVFSTCTPLSLAIENQDPESVKMVLESYHVQQRKFDIPGIMSKGIVNASSDAVRLPLMQAVERALFSNKGDIILKIIEILLECQADPNGRDAQGARLSNSRGTYTVYTPYELAEARGYHDIISLFDLYSDVDRNSH